MDFMKVFDQTVREIRREVNLKVLKIPEIEQKVLDATDNEPWGPHGSALSEIAQATRKFTECLMVMNVLWTRLKETDKDWRHVYKALTVIEYLVANGSERAVDDIIEHTFQIASLSTFEYVEPNGKDVGLNVRKKAETIVGLLNNKEKIQETRNKAAANRDKYVGHSSKGITYKSGSAASYGSGSFGSSNCYGGFGGMREGSFRDSNKDRETDRYGEEKTKKDASRKSHQGAIGENQPKKATHCSSKDEDKMQSTSSKSSAKLKASDKNNSAPPQSSSIPSNNVDDDDFDDFDPRGTSNTKPAAGNSNQVDLFGDIMDAPTPVPVETSPAKSNSSEVDLFENAAFVSAAPQVEKTVVDLFASQPTLPSAAPTTVDLFSAPDPVVQPETEAPKSDPTDTNVVDPFAAVPLNNFAGSDSCGSITSNSSPVSPEHANHPPTNGGSQSNLGRKSSAGSNPSPKKDAFQVKSGIWADSLSRGLIDLNISAPKKASLENVGIVGGLSESDERDKRPPTMSLQMGRAMGAGTGPGIGNSSRFPSSSQGKIGDDFFSSLGNQPYQHGSFQK